jgi:RimJ/RimL family protein N-acetyltransferase
MAESLEGPDRPVQRPPIVVRPARLRDVGAIVNLYRSQDEASRELYHPFPFDWPRATAIFGFFAASRPFLPRLLRRIPRRAVVLLVACRTGERRPIAYGMVAFTPTPDGGRRAIFGYHVAPSARGLGIGTWLHIDMIEAAVALGVRRGGGMVVSSNRSNLRVLEKIGFTITESDVVDSEVPNAKNYVTDGDLAEIARQWRATHPS